MKKHLLVILVLLCYHTYAQQAINLSSPDRNIQLTVGLSVGGELSYSVDYKNRPVILPSGLSMKFKEPDVELKQFTLQTIDSSAYDQTWRTVWGEYSSIRDLHKELKLSVQDKNGSGILMSVIFRVFNEGVGFRYEFPDQEKLDHFVLADERTQFHLTGDHKHSGYRGIMIRMNLLITPQS